VRVVIAGRRRLASAYQRASSVPDDAMVLCHNAQASQRP